MTPTDDPSTPARPAVSGAGRRLRRALLRPGRGQIVVGLLLAVLGAATVTQVRLAGTDDDYTGMRQADLVQALNGLQAAATRTEQEISDLQQTRDSLRSTRNRRDVALKQAREELTVLGVLAGTVPASGPGIRIKVEIPEDQLSLNYLLDGIEELRDAGAEAMEFNDSVRVVAQTSFEEGPDGLEVGGQPVRAPYVIDVIGDPDTLSTGIHFPGGFVDDVSLDGGSVTVTKHSSIQITAVREPTAPRFAQPVR